MPSKGVGGVGGVRYYNPQAVTGELENLMFHQQILLQQQQQVNHNHHNQHQQQMYHQNQQQQQVYQPQQMVYRRRVTTEDEEEYSVNADVALSAPREIRSLEGTNLDRVIKTVTPFIQARFLSQVAEEVNKRGSGTREVDSHTFFCLEDLWESFVEKSAYGVGVPLLLNGKDPTEQFYTPFLSGIQLYVDPSKSSSRLGPRAPNEDNAISYRLPGSAGSNGSGGDRRPNPLMISNMQPFDQLSLGDTSNSEADIPTFSFLETEQPRNRKPLADQINSLCIEYPDLAKLRSCDLLPTSWIGIAWYPIYRIPMGSTLRDLDASFLTFHYLSTQPRSNCPPQFHAPNTTRVKGFVDPAPKISLPVFALVAYKLKGSIVSPCGPLEREQEKSLEEAAGSWLSQMNVSLPDYNFFRTHSYSRR